MIRKVQRQSHNAVLHVIDRNHHNGNNAKRSDHRAANDGKNDDVDKQQTQKVFAEIFKRKQ